MARITAQSAGGVNVVAFLDTIAQSEIGAALLAASDDGYDVEVGSTPQRPILFDSYADHPGMLMVLNSGLKSTAAGRYQFLHVTWEDLRAQLSLPDFSPTSQDLGAIELLRQCGALACIEGGMIPDAVRHCSHIWASFPSAGYGQPENKMTELLGWYSDALAAQATNA